VRRALLFWLAALALPANPAPPPHWRLTRSEHFEVYAQSSDQSALAILTRFEQLRAFFEQQGGAPTGTSPVRVIVFDSEQEYQPYRLRATADAYYVGTSSRDYIVMGTDDPLKFGRAAHEYAHLALRASGLSLPPWLTEGLADFFSTLRITRNGTELGGALSGRVRTLQTRPWMPLAELVSLSEESRSRQDRDTADLFYAESWALTEMLMLSPKYAPSFQKILASPTLDAAALTRDLHKWVALPQLPVIQLPEIDTPPVRVEVSSVPSLDARLVLAQVLLAAGEFDRAKTRFQALAIEAPQSAEVSSALGMIALHNGDSEGARRAWKRAIEQGMADAKLCYQYAILADQGGLSPDEIRPALERAVRLQPDFDDAHYQLALLEKNARNYDAALREFRAIRSVSEPRAYAYWLALADTYNELGRRDEARSAAQRASAHATTAAEHSRAAQQIYMAQTDVSVQFSRDADGHSQMVAVRVPHQQSDWNPFIEPGDDIHHVRGTLRSIECGDVTAIGVEEAGTLLRLAIPDLQHVQMRHAPAEFVCGPQTPTPVTVDYAGTPGSVTDGVVRGMEF
jgi:tetratricopeptide (TPR) repeat protein